MYRNNVQIQDIYYDDYGNSIYVEDEVGNWKYFYDSALRPVAMQDPRDYGTQAYTQQISYDGWSRALTATDRMGNVQKADYKSLRTDYSFVPAGSTAAENHYSEIMDMYGNVVEVRNYPAGMSETVYESISYTYDLAGNMTQMTDANGNVTEYAYDKLNQLVQTEQADGSVIKASYTKFGTPLEIRQASDGEEYTIARSYDDRGLEISTEQKGKNIPTRPWNYTYNAAGQLLSMEDPSGGVRSYGYDDAGNVVTEQLGGEERDRTYNYLGQTTKVVKKEHGNTQNHAEYLYNEETGWLVEKEIASSATVEYEYTDMGSVDMVKVSNGVMRNYIRDDLERTTSIVIDGGDSFGYEYYGDGAIKAVIYPTGDIRTDYTYDNANRVKTIVSKKGSTVLHQASYTYDGNGNILTITGTDPVTYTYDSMNRLASETRNGTTTTYEYDSRDNLVKETTGSTVTEYTYAGDNRLTQKETNGTITTYEYDLNGNLIGDSAGNVYGYDEENRLVYASTDVGNMQYTITAEGLRSGKSGSVSGASYVTDIDGKVIKENEAEIIVGHQALAKKIGDAYYYYIYNAHGDVIMMVDESGNIVNQYEYDAWGKITEETETVANSIKYAGEYYDEETGFIYLRNRMYDPTTRRFTSEDPARDQLNWYAYCGNNPVMCVDPWGLDAETIAAVMKLLELKDFYNTYGYSSDPQLANDIRWWLREASPLKKYAIYENFVETFIWDNNSYESTVVLLEIAAYCTAVEYMKLYHAAENAQEMWNSPAEAKYPKARQRALDYNGKITGGISAVFGELTTGQNYWMYCGETADGAVQIWRTAFSDGSGGEITVKQQLFDGSWDTIFNMIITDKGMEIRINNGDTTATLDDLTINRPN